MRADRRATSALALGFGLLLALGLGSSLLVALRQPLGGGDYVAIWGLKARALFRTGELASVLAVDPEGTFAHPEYPPLWPLLLASVSRLLGRYDELWLALLRPLLLAAAAWAAARATRAPAPFPLLTAALVALLPAFHRGLYGGYAETPLVLFLLLALGAAGRGDHPWDLALLGSWLALAALTKNEGALAALAAGAVLLAGRRRAAAAVAFLALAAGVVPWALFRGAEAASRPLADFSLDSFDAGKAASAASALAREVGFTGLLWLLGAGLLLALAPGTRRARRGLLAAALLHAALLLGAFAFARVDPAWLVRWSWDRLALPLLALLAVVLAEALAEATAAADPHLAARDGSGVEALGSLGEELGRRPVGQPLPEDREGPA